MLRQHRLMRLFRERHGVIWEGFERTGPQRGVRQKLVGGGEIGEESRKRKRRRNREEWGMGIDLLGEKEGAGDRTRGRRP